MKLRRCSSTDPAFLELVALLDADLARRDGDEHAFYAQFNTVEALEYCVVLEDRGQPISCGAIKSFDPGTMEVKRMFTRPDSRGAGLARRILGELEKWAGELDKERCVLETGKRQPEAVAFYRARGYKAIPNYGQYIGVENSLCFEKTLSA